ncbi:cobalt ECF transporter T component CbiQ [Paenibacillus validus]|uniref:cobalt ECF transporter T component CbiQ n=2 Tax=Paenibacillus validus TaxID=44253 RepID=UPI000FD6D27E|nr:cobalt ECF transporter T component CbiQ [Paenibacillus validus]MED4604990.1 cobalt ECF transporter T component CbiQ [Paenibacillus validus]
MIHTIDSLSYTNKLRHVSPMWKCGFAAVLLTLAYAAQPAVQAAIFCWMLVWTVGYAGIPLKTYSWLFGASCFFYVTSLPAWVIEAASSAASVRPDALLAVPVFRRWLYISPAALVQAVEVFVRIAACEACLLFIVFTIPFPELMQVMKRLRMPQAVLELMVITYRFLFHLSDAAQGMIAAQRARGGHAGFWRTLRDVAALLVQLFAKTMHRYRGLSQGLMSRGFTGELHFMPYEPKPIPGRYGAEGILGAATLALLSIWLRVGGV